MVGSGITTSGILQKPVYLGEVQETRVVERSHSASQKVVSVLLSRV